MPVPVYNIQHFWIVVIGRFQGQEKHWDKGIPLKSLGDKVATDHSKKDSTSGVIDLGC